MKNLKFLTLAIILIVTSLTCCLKDPGTPVVAAGKSTVAVNEEVTFTLSGADNYTCLVWLKLSGPDYTLVSGGTNQDRTMTVKFTGTGTATIQISVKNCKDGCSGKCRDEYAETSITVQ